MNCPKCGEEMEIGLLEAESFIGGLKWISGPSRRSEKEVIAKPGVLGNIHLKGSRCKKCKLLVLQY